MSSRHRTASLTSETRASYDVYGSRRPRPRWPIGSLLAVGNIDGTARVWHTSGQSGLVQVATLQAGTEPVDSIALADSGRVAAAGDNGGTLWLWDLPAGTSASVQGQQLLSMPAGGAIFGLAAAGDQLTGRP